MARVKLSALALASGLVLSACASADGQALMPLDATWLDQIEQQAIQDGVSPQTVHQALDSFVPNPRVVAWDHKQPEGTISFAAYRRNIVSPSRIAKGIAVMQKHITSLRAIENQTGVPPQIVVALWGIESSYGRDTGNYETVNALATLALEGRRAAFFRGELISALHILDQEHIPSEKLRGSWAGAMGQCQFMPSTYLKYAVDGDGDGKRDIWANPADVMASIAHYLAAEGWRGDLTWGREVTADEISPSEIGLNQQHHLQEWSDMGVTNADGSPLPGRDLTASLIQPDGSDGASFLIYDNLRALMRWNHSTAFAVSVGLLADAIKAGD